MPKPYALVTGASSGIGLSLAQQLAEKDYNLILVARRKERLEDLKSEIIKKHAIDIVIIAQDLAEENAGLKLFEATAPYPVEILINNAGYGMQGKFVEMDFAAIEKMFQVNMVSLTQLTGCFARAMLKRRHGYIMNVASAAAFLPSPYVSAYAATKAYVLAFSEALRFELIDTGVSLTTLYPGITTTEFNAVAGAKTPPWLNLSILSADQVARIGLGAMFARRRAIVPGIINKLNAFFSHFLPRGMVIWFAGKALAQANGN